MMHVSSPCVSRAIALAILLALLTTGISSGVNLTFNGSVTVNPTEVGEYYDMVNATNLSWVEIGKIVPLPLVDTFGGGELGWRIMWLSAFSICLLIMFGRQQTILIPMMVVWISAFMILQVIPPELSWMFYAFSALGFAGIIFYFAVSNK